MVKWRQAANSSGGDHVSVSSSIARDTTISFIAIFAFYCHIGPMLCSSLGNGRDNVSRNLANGINTVASVCSMACVMVWLCSKDPIACVMVWLCSKDPIACVMVWFCSKDHDIMACPLPRAISTRNNLSTLRQLVYDIACTGSTIRQL